MSAPKFRSAPAGATRPHATRNAQPEQQIPMMEAGEGPTDVELRTVADKAREIVQLENANADLSGQIRKNADRIKVLEEVELPAAMKATGQTTAPLSGGYSAKCEDFVAAHILKENKVPALLYVRREGGEDNIKNELVVSFPMGCEKLAKAAIDALKKLKAVKVRLKKGKKWTEQTLTVEQAHGGPLALEESIHQGTLTRWVKDRKEAGKPVDPNYITVYEGMRAWVERPKAEGTTQTGM